jgi:hypothetical protein
MVIYLSSPLFLFNLQSIIYNISNPVETTSIIYGSNPISFSLSIPLVLED